MSSATSGDGASVIVAIPACNEEERIAACLQALGAQTTRDGSPLARGTFEVLLLVNNSDDATAETARSLASALPFDLDVTDVELGPDDANAGGARRLVMAEAARRLTALGLGNGVLMTTDADTCVPPRWVADILGVIDAGVDAVVGGLRLDAAEEAMLPPALRRRGALEGRYEALLCELQCRLDPNVHDPWPRHTCEPGASLALTLESFLAIGGVPKRALGEDRAICDALRRGGFRIRHAPEATVTTSGRLVGRAPGGCADTMRLRIEDPDARCDPTLEPVWSALRRYLTPASRRSSPTRPGVHPQSLPLQILLAEAALALLRRQPDQSARPAPQAYNPRREGLTEQMSRRMGAGGPRASDAAPHGEGRLV